jgi:hypothetical protein
MSRIDNKNTGLPTIPPLDIAAQQQIQQAQIGQQGVDVEVFVPKSQQFQRGFGHNFGQGLAQNQVIHSNLQKSVQSNIIGGASNTRFTGVESKENQLRIGESVRNADHASETQLGMVFPPYDSKPANIRTPGGFNIKFDDTGSEFSVSKAGQKHSFRIEQADDGSYYVKTNMGKKLPLPGSVVLEDGTKLNFALSLDGRGRPQINTAIMCSDSYTTLTNGKISGSSADSLTRSVAQTLGIEDGDQALAVAIQQLHNLGASNYGDLLKQTENILGDKKGVLSSMRTAADIDRLYPDGKDGVNKYLEIRTNGVDEYETKKINNSEFIVTRNGQITRYRSAYENGKIVLYRDGQRVNDDDRKIEHGRYMDAEYGDAKMTRSMFFSWFSNMMNNMLQETKQLQEKENEE